MASDRLSPKRVFFRSFCIGPSHASWRGSRWLLVFVSICVAIVASGCGVHLNLPSTTALKATLKADPDSISFGAVALGQSATSDLTLLNAGNAKVQLTSITVTGGEFALGGQQLPTVLNPGQQVTVPLQFEAEVAGPASGAVTIADSTSDPVTVALSGTGTALPEPHVTTSANSLSFGNVTIGSTATKVLRLTSSGTGAAVVSSISLAGAEFSITPPSLPVTLQPGQDLLLPVKFNPSSSGQASGQITVGSNANDPPSVSLSGTGVTQLEPEIAVSAESLNFGSSNLGTAAPSQSFTITSSGTAALTVNAISLSAASAAAGFHLPSISLPVTLSPGRKLTVQVDFTPAELGAAQGQVAISSNSSSGDPVVNLSGTGASPGVAQISLSPASLDFGTLTVGSSSTQSIVIQNSGTAALTVSSAAASGAGFSVVGTSFPVTLSAGQQLAIQVKFNPSSAGAVTGQVVIASNASGTAAVPLKGTGQTASHYVDLTWNAPSSSPDPVMGYDIYRSTQSSGGFTMLSGSNEQTTYTDLNVQSGATYYYVVRSVDASGVESADSNEISVLIP